MKRALRRMAAWCGWAILSALIAATFPFISQAQVGNLQELRTAPAPDWVRPGMRLTFYSALGNVATGEEFWERDENGAWEDPLTHERFSKRKAPDAGSGSGHGYTQVNVVSMDGGVAVLEVRAYGYPRYEGPLALISASSTVTVPGFGNDWWANPGVLQRAQTGRLRGLSVLRMNHDLDGKRYPALRLQFEGKRSAMLTGMGGEVRTGELKSRNVLVYSLDSGVLLYAATAAPTVKGTTFTHATLKNTRVVSVPWAGRPAPAWLGQAREFSYSGALTVPVTGRPTTIPLSAKFTLLRRGRDWAQFRSTSALASPIQGLPTTNQAELVTGSAQFGGLWIPPEAMGGLRAGQVLDRDPITGVTVSVSRADGNVVVISEANQIQRMDFTYRRDNGLMVEYRKVDGHQYNLTTTLRFTGWR